MSINIVALMLRARELDFRAMDKNDFEAFNGADDATLIAYDKNGNAYLLSMETETLTICNADLSGETEISLNVLER